MSVAATEQQLSGPVHLGRFSDEELVLLDAEHPLVLLPWYATLSAQEQEWAVGSALRSLAACGLELSGAGEIQLPQHVQDVLDIRAGADHILMMQVLTSPDPRSPQAISVLTLHYVYVIEDVIVLEDVAGNGLHDFWLLDRESLAAVLQGRVPVAGAQDGLPPAYRVDLTNVAAGQDRVTDRIGEVVCQVDATAWHAPETPEPILLGVLLGERGTYASCAAAECDGPLSFTPVRRDAVGQEVVRLLTLTP